ncbi:Ubiquitin-conjugating enzyme E2 [Dillenia turbinata]|uniref:Ubiquitin-conjugating enzyme E2 n=1 Tax=Dillenia turbinata TaxID=194707 RepID=A0AAN8YVH8_9MAGN
MAIFSFLYSFTKPKPLPPIKRPIPPCSKDEVLKRREFAKSRIINEFVHSKKDPPFHCSCGPINQDDYFNWTGAIIGPSETPYEGGVFFLSIKFTEQHPFRPPIIKFQTKIYHPNVDQEDGTIHLDLLGSYWSPAPEIHKLLLSICSFLSDPNPDEDPSKPISNLYKNDRKMYDKVARMWTLKYAMSWSFAGGLDILRIT